jgi:DNA mismatch repair ATPase MutS
MATIKLFNEKSKFAAYRSLKASYPGAILFFRQGDFYEAYHAAAAECAEKFALEIRPRVINEHVIRFVEVASGEMESVIQEAMQTGLRVVVFDNTTMPDGHKKNFTRVISP